MRTRILALVAAVAACVGTALVAVPLSHADAVGSFTYKVLDMCAGPSDQQCVMSATRNGTPVTSDYPSTVGTHEWFYVDNSYRDGNFGFNLNTITVPPSGPPTASKDVDKNATWVIKVNTGPYVPRELNLKARNVDFTKGGNPTDGYWFQLQFNPVPIAWRWHFGTTDAGGPYGCSLDACGDDTTIAEFASADGEGVADGYVTDLGDSDLGSRYVYARTGFFLASNAQVQSEPYYDADTNSLIVAMANPHLRTASAQAFGYFEAFLPNSYLMTQLGVPDPSTLTGGSFTVQRVGSTTTKPFTLVNTGDGVLIKVADIGFSRPKYRIKPKPRVPGKPRLTGVKKIVGGARSSFLPPLLNGGKPVDLYQAACRKSSTVPFKFKTGTKSPITVTALPSGTVYCQVRAHNSVGWGPWGKAAASHA